MGLSPVSRCCRSRRALGRIEVVLATLGSVQATWPEAQSACRLSQAPITFSQQLCSSWGVPGVFSNPWLSHISSSVLCAKSNTREICARSLLTFNGSWAVPHRCTSEFLLPLMRKGRRCALCQDGAETRGLSLAVILIFGKQMKRKQIILRFFFKENHF